MGILLSCQETVFQEDQNMKIYQHLMSPRYMKDIQLSSHTHMLNKPFVCFIGCLSSRWMFCYSVLKRSSFLNKPVHEILILITFAATRVQYHQSLHCSHTQRWDLDEDEDQTLAQLHSCTRTLKSVFMRMRK